MEETDMGVEETDMGVEVRCAPVPAIKMETWS